MDVRDGVDGPQEPTPAETAAGTADNPPAGTAGGTPAETAAGTADNPPAETAGGTPAETGDGGAMTVEVDGRTRRLPAEHDYTGDGRPDAAVETPDGTVVVFADTEDNATGAPGPDGKADEAYVVDKRTGRVIGAAHVRPGTGEWVDDDGAPAPPAGPESGSR
jgi:hypothetical protein